MLVAKHLNKIFYLTALCLLAVFFVTKNADAVGVEVGSGTFTLGAGQNVYYGVTSAANANGNFLLFEKGAGTSVFKVDKDGNLTTSGSISGASLNLTGALSAGNISSGTFGSNTGGGNYNFSGNVGIGTTNPGQRLDVFGGSIRTSNQLISTVAAGTAPLLVTSNTLVSNLNSDLVDGYQMPDINPVNIYSGQKVLITTSINSGSYSMFKGSIMVMDFNNATPSYIYFSGTMNPDNTIHSTKAYAIGKSYDIAAFIYNGKLCFWFTADLNYNNVEVIVTQGSAYQGTYVNKNFVTTLTTVDKPAGTNEVTISPSKIFDGSGTANYLPKFSGVSTLGNSLIYDNGTNVGIGTTNPAAKFQVFGSAIFGGSNGNGINILGTGEATGLSLSSSASGYKEIQSYESEPLYINRLGNNVLFNSMGGNVGIGTTDPGTYKLNVTGNTNITGTLNVTGAVTGGTMTGTLGASNVSAGAFASNTGGGNFSFSGNVGIGIVNPANKLEVVPNGGFISIPYQASKTDGIKLGLGNTSGYIWRNYIGENTDKMILSNNWVVTDDGTSSIPNSLNSTSAIKIGLGKLDFQVGGVNTAPSSALFIKSDGNVGIGTTNPNQLLSLGVASGKISFARGNGEASYGTLGFKGTTGNDNYLLELENKSGTGEIRINQSSLASPIGVTLYTAAVERLRVDGAGNVGIGTTGPTQKLDVAGNIMLNRNSLSWSREQYDFASSTVRANINPFSIKIWDNYTGASAPTTYGTLLDIYGYSGHEQSQLYFGSDGNIRYRDAFYSETSFSPWSTLLLSTTDVNSSGNLRITGAGVHYISTGNVGIGTTTPAYKLDVRATGPSYFDQPVFVGTPTANGHAATKNYVDSLINPLGGGGGTVGYWNASGANVYNVNTGNIGIGTNNPIFKLHLVDTNGGFFFDGSGASYNRFKSTAASAATGRDLLFSAQDSGTSPDLYIKNNGNVGIGTTDPGTYKLNVNGNTNITGSLNVTGAITGGTMTGTLGAGNVSAGAFASNTGGGNFSFPGNVGIGTTNPGSSLDIESPGSTTLAIGMPAGATSGTIGILKFQRGVSDWAWAGIAGVSNYTDQNGLAFYTTPGGTVNAIERMRISQGGNVGIGTTNPGQKLDVVGNLRLNGDIVYGNQSATYKNNYVRNSSFARARSASSVDDWTLSGAVREKDGGRDYIKTSGIYYFASQFYTADDINNLATRTFIMSADVKNTTGTGSVLFYGFVQGSNPRWVSWGIYKPSVTGVWQRVVSDPITFAAGDTYVSEIRFYNYPGSNGDTVYMGQS